LLAWLAFCALMLAAAAVDLLVISRQAADLPPCLAGKFGSLPTFARQIVFWLLVGVLFNVLIWVLLGQAAAGAWLYGYILEYILSIDNVFVFRAVFLSYSTPSLQVERALFWGISVAVVLRLLFFGVGTELLSMGFLARVAFGLALVYSGVKTLRSSDDDDEGDPRDNPLVQCIARLLPVSESYTDDAAFFVRTPDSSGSAELQPPATMIGASTEEAAEAKLPADESATGKDRFDPGWEGGRMPASDTGRTTLRVTPLFLVVVTLGIVDVIFAVDSVTAKISSVTGLGVGLSFFLNLSSSAFAMFVLRSLYHVVSILASMFRFLGYGVGIVLVLIGVKLILSGHVDVGMFTSCVIILTILIASILLSVAVPTPPDGGRPLPSPAESQCELQGEEERGAGKEAGGYSPASSPPRNEALFT